MQKKWGHQRDKVNFETYDITAWLVKNLTHILLNISQIKGNQKVKFGQLTQEKKFSLKGMQKIRQGNQFETSSCFLTNFIVGKSKWSAA